MATTSAIEWCDATWNPIRGCGRVSAGCEHCYAERVAYRFGQKPGAPYEGLTTLGKQGPRWNGRVRFVPEMLDEPLKWHKPRRVFVNSMSDLFHEDITDEQIAAVFGVMAATPRHTFQVLTKRPSRMRRWFEWMRDQDCTGPGEPPASVVCGIHAANHGADVDYLGLVGAWPLPNVWLGVSCENQAVVDERIPLLLDCPAAVRFVSAEPLLAPIDVEKWICDWCPKCKNDYPLRQGRCDRCGVFRRARSTESRVATDGETYWYTGLHWVIVGGESGPGARPCRLSWIQSVVQQCAATRVPCFVKQLGGLPWDDTRARGVDIDMKLRDRKGGDPLEWPDDLRVRRFPEVQP